MMSHIPVIIMTALLLMSLGRSINRKAMKQETNGGFLVELIGTIVILGLLYWGGFYDIWFKK